MVAGAFAGLLWALKILVLIWAAEMGLGLVVLWWVLAVIRRPIRDALAGDLDLSIARHQQDASGRRPR